MTDREQTGNLVLLEHVNLQIADPLLATQFYVVGLQLTRDPFLMVGLDNMWVNAGRTQFHLPTHATQPQRLRGTIGLVVPDLDRLEASLAAAAPGLAGTRFAFEREAGGTLVAVCPWGNRLRCHAPDAARWGAIELGIVSLDLDVPAGTAPAIAAFYRSLIGAPAAVESRGGQAPQAVVRVGGFQRLNFVETEAPIAPYDGHHIQVYMADFAGAHRRLVERGLVSRESDAHEWRFVDIVDPRDGALLTQLEHEVRSLQHPLYGRSFVNRNPAQTNRSYVRGLDNFRGTC